METNVYLKNSKLYKKSLFINVSSSAAIELRTLSPSIIHALKKEKTPKIIFSPFNEKE
jgi:hypothetical protein